MLDRRRMLAAGVAALAPIRSVSAATPGVTETEIRIGNTHAYSGPASSYATNAKTEAAYFRMVNERGGIGGRKLTFISYDDGASPPRAVEQVRKLIEQDEVAILFNTFSTAGNSATVRYVNQKKVPQLFIYSGADKFNDPKTYPWTMGWQPSYRTEGQVYARYLQKERPGGKLGILHQNDDFGKDYLAGVRDVLGASAPIATATHEITDASIDSQLLSLQSAGVDTLITATSPKFVALAIRKLPDMQWKPFHIITNVATSIAAVMQPAGLDRAVGTVSSAYIKDPNDPTWADDPDLRGWREFMAKHYPEGDLKDINNVIGYCFAQSLEKVLQACGQDFSRETIMKQATNLQGVRIACLLPGITLNTTPTDYRPIRQLQMARFDGKSWVRFGEVITS